MFVVKLCKEFGEVEKPEAKPSKKTQFPWNLRSENKN